jgi:hypothetical protein
LEIPPDTINPQNLSKMNSLETNAKNSIISYPSSSSSPGFGKPNQNTTTIAEFLSNNNLYSPEDNARYLLDPIVRYDSQENPESVLVVPSVLSSTQLIDTEMMMTSNLPSESPTEVLFPPFPSDLFNRLSSTIALLIHSSTQYGDPITPSALSVFPLEMNDPKRFYKHIFEQYGLFY